MSHPDSQPPLEPMVRLIERLAQTGQQKALRDIQNLIYQPFNTRFHHRLFSVLPDKENDARDYNALRQAYRLVGPLMAHYPRTTETGNFGHSLGRLEQFVSANMVERKLGIIQQSPKLHLAEPALLSLVRLMKQHEISVNWSRLVNDARYWNEQSVVGWYEGLTSIRKRKEKEEAV